MSQSPPDTGAAPAEAPDPTDPSAHTAPSAAAARAAGAPAPADAAAAMFADAATSAGAPAETPDPAAGPGPARPSRPERPSDATPSMSDPHGQRAATLRLIVVVGLITVVSITAGVGKTVAVLAAIILMIVLHEFGHFLMAKLAGIKVTEFFVGFGTRLWSIRLGETEYGVKVLPLGGYVKIIGMNNIEEVDPADEPRTYRQQPFWRRFSVVVAGSAMHFLIALVLLFTIFFVVGDQGIFPVPGNGPGRNAQVTEIDALATGRSPAQQAGFQVGDRVLSVNGTVPKTLDDLTSYIRQRPQQTLDFQVKRNGHVIDLHPTTVDLSQVKAKASPGAPVPSATKPTGFIGFALAPPTAHYGLFTSINKSGAAFVDAGARTFDALGGLFSAHGVSSYANMLVNQKAANAPNAVRFESPVGIVRLAHQASSNGLEDTLYLLILINIFVGIFNMAPLLPLDGGHVAIAVYEKIRSRKGRRYYADAAKVMPIFYATIVIIVFIALSSLFLDLRDVLSIVKF